MVLGISGMVTNRTAITSQPTVCYRSCNLRRSASAPIFWETTIHGRRSPGLRLWHDSPGRCYFAEGTERKDLRRIRRFPSVEGPWIWCLAGARRRRSVALWYQALVNWSIWALGCLLNFIVPRIQYIRLGNHVKRTTSSSTMLGFLLKANYKELAIRGLA